MDDDMKTIAKTDHPPIVIQNSKGLFVAARSIPRAVILKSSTYIIEGLAVIGIYLVELA
ncbi:hypothetical protein ES705_45086 [subsurface metagenome]